MNLLQQTEKIYKSCWKSAMTDDLLNQIPEGFTFSEWLERKWKMEMGIIRKQIIPKYHELKQVLIEGKVMKSDEEKIKDRWALITLRPEPNSCNLQQFIKDVNKVVNKSLIIECEYAFEQTGDNDNNIGQGFHVHILAKLRENCNVQHIITACKFIKYNCIVQVGSKTGKKFLSTNSDLEYCKNYIRGDKHNKDKEPAVAMDKIWRMQNGLQDLYSRQSSPSAG